MDRRITSRLNMANAFQQVCKGNAANVALVAAFDPLVRRLGTIISALQELMQSLSGNTQTYRTNRYPWAEIGTGANCFLGRAGERRAGH